MAAYEYKIPSLFKASANVAGAICEALERSEGGLTPATLLEASRPADAPLHDEFEWNDAIAAEKHRLNQAHKIINNLVLVTTEDARLVNAFVNVKPLPQKGAYVSMRAAMTNEEMRKAILKNAYDEMVTFTAKYRSYEELAGVIEAMNAAMKQ